MNKFNIVQRTILLNISLFKHLLRQCLRYFQPYISIIFTLGKIPLLTLESKIHLYKR